MQSISQKLPVNVVVSSILLALFADTKVINLIIATARPSLAGSFMALMYAIVIAGLFCLGLFIQRRRLTALSPSYIGICFLCILWYLITSTFIGEPSVPVTFFVIFTITAFIIPGIIRIDVKTFLMALFIMPSVGIFFIEQIFVSEVLETGVVSMGTCYALLVPVLANLVYWRFYYSLDRVIVKALVILFSAINIFYLIQMAMYGSRGPILCVILLLASFFIIKVDTNNNHLSIRKGRVLTISLLAIIISVSFIPILQAISDYLASFDISVNVIDKFLRMEDTGDLSNGREAIDSITWNGIFDSPLLGHGIAQFKRNTGIVYPHNFLLQLLYDGGLFLSLSLLIPIMRNIIRKMRRPQTNETICLIFLFFASVPGALFSGDLWQATLLWIFFGFVLSDNSVYEYKS